MEEITFKTVDGVTCYSCGCKDEKIGKNYFFSPCSGDCEVFKYAIKETKNQGKRIEVQLAPKEGK